MQVRAAHDTAPSAAPPELSGGRGVGSRRQVPPAVRSSIHGDPCSSALPTAKHRPATAVQAIPVSVAPSTSVCAAEAAAGSMRLPAAYPNVKS
jgi:hypothetical protein